MFSLIIIIGAIAGILLIGIVLIQNPKGGGLASNFSSANNIFGVQKSSDGVEKGTWLFAAIILVVSLMSSYYNGSESKSTGDSKTRELMDAKPGKSSAPKPAETPTSPMPPQGGAPAPTPVQ